MKKRIMIFTLILALALASAATACAGSSYITDGKSLRGRDFTDIPVLAERLDRVFAGAPDMYLDARCQSLAPAELGSRGVPLGKTYYVKSQNGSVYSGTSCYIYANAVYATLFGDVPYHGEPGTWENSERVVKNLSSASYSAFSSAGVCFGALLRTTPNSDGSYNGNSGHSIVILKYDSSGLTYLEGNGDGKGLVRLTARSWDTFNSVSVSGRGYRISFIVQPTWEYLSSLSGARERENDFVGYLTRRLDYDGRFKDVPASAWYAVGVETAYELGIIGGRSVSKFAPEEYVTVAEGLTLAARFLSSYYDDGYSFAGTGAWYAPYYEYCGKWGIDTGFKSPNALMTRAELAAVMVKALPAEARTSGAALSFRDVPSGAPYARAVEVLSASGIIRGDGGLFRPDAPLKRSELAVMTAMMADRSLRAD